MKQIALLVFSIILMPICLMSQSDIWSVKAVADNGNTLPINAYFEDGTPVPVYAIYDEGNDHFMDVKAVHNGVKISIKLLTSDNILVPVKGISDNGDIMDVKAVDTDGTILDVKGVSRDGNTINIAAIQGGSNLPLIAISPEGVKRDVKGIKFLAEKIEMEFGDLKVISHVKALPTIEVGEIENRWDVLAYNDNKESMKLVAINKKGKEYPIQAEMQGKRPYFMNVRGQQSSLYIFIKLIKKDKGTVLTGIDEYGRLYDVRAKTENGESYEVVGGKTTGNVTPILVLGPNGQEYPVKAISSEGHVFDVKGIKAKEDEVEGMISGLNVWIRYFAHVKALAPAQVND
jgi:hypothetical protein